MRFFNRPKFPDLVEIHQYTKDIERITMLRDKSQDADERERYNTVISVMLDVLEFLNTLPEKR